MILNFLTIKTTSNSLINSFFKDQNMKDSLKRRTKSAIDHFQKANPDIDLNTYITDTRLLTKKKLIKKQDEMTHALKNLITHLEKMNLSASAITNYRSSIRQFHEYHHMELPPSEWKKIRQLQTTTGDKFDHASPTRENLQKILSNANALEKAYYLTAITSGRRPDEILKIEVEDLHLDEKPPRIAMKTPDNQRKRRTKYAFITEECKDAIQTYLEQRHRFIEKITTSNLPIKNKQKFYTSKQLFQFCYRTARDHWITLLQKAGLDEHTTKGDLKRYRFNQYMLRHYFRTYLGNSDLAEHLMGHTDISNMYYSKQIHEIAQDYQKYSKNLYIYGNQNTDEKIKQELKEKDEQIQRLITNDELNKQKMLEMEQKLNNLTTLMQTIGKPADSFHNINGNLYQWDEEMEMYCPVSTKEEFPDHLDKNKKPIHPIRQVKRKMNRERVRRHREKTKKSSTA